MRVYKTPGIGLGELVLVPGTVQEEVSLATRLTPNYDIDDPFVVPGGIGDPVAEITTFEEAREAADAGTRVAIIRGTVLDAEFRKTVHQASQFLEVIAGYVHTPEQAAMLEASGASGLLIRDHVYNVGVPLANAIDAVYGAVQLPLGVLTDRYWGVAAGLGASFFLVPEDFDTSYARREVEYVLQVTGHPNLDELHRHSVFVLNK